ncbi:MAG: hypothetical protein KIS78_19040 [Labilithrix sp.]|nr:hypothetical protein [Labilithrix sp.]
MRPTRFEARTIHIGPNGFALECSPRDVPPDVVLEDGREVIRALRTPTLEVQEDALDAEDFELAVAFLTMLERKFAGVFDAWANAPGRIVDVVNETIEAEKRLAAAKLEAARIEAANIAARAEAEELDRNLAVLRGATKAGAAST